MELEAAKAIPITDKAESGNTALAALKLHFSSGAGSPELGSGAARTQRQEVAEGEEKE
jgi:hypothetical protein